MNTSGHVFVVSEWLPKAHKEEEMWKHANEIMAQTKKEKGCLRAHATRQIKHPHATGTSKYTIVLFQEYVSLEAFNAHCLAPYVSRFFEKYVENPDTAIVQEYTVRVFSEETM